MSKPKKRLYRNNRRGIIGGVCAGLADYFNIDVAIIRVIYVLLIIFSFSFFLFLYLLAWIIIPKEELGEYCKPFQRQNKYSKKQSSCKDFDTDKKYRSVNRRLANIETIITSKEWQLRRKFKDIENK